MNRPLSFRRQVECLIESLNFEVASLERLIKEADEEMETLNSQSLIYAMKYGYREAYYLERIHLERILKAAKIALAESTQMVPS